MQDESCNDYFQIHPPWGHVGKLERIIGPRVWLGLNRPVTSRKSDLHRDAWLYAEPVIIDLRLLFSSIGAGAT